MASDEAEEEDVGSRWFSEYTDRLNKSVIKPGVDDVAHACPCCRCMTLGERGGFEICPVCLWEDDGQDDQDASVVRGGPNGSLSLSQARENFKAFGACDERAQQHVRNPNADELPR
jgi:hypothetical protein